MTARKNKYPVSVEYDGNVEVRVLDDKLELEWPCGHMLTWTAQDARDQLARLLMMTTHFNDVIVVEQDSNGDPYSYRLDGSVLKVGTWRLSLIRPMDWPALRKALLSLIRQLPAPDEDERNQVST